MNQPRNFLRPTIGDVAERAGVSIATVSRVLNQSATVASETIKKVIEAVETLNYQPQAAARVLASNRTNTVGLLLSDIGKAFFAPMLKGIEEGIREGGFDLMIYSISDNTTRDRSRYPLGEHNTDGLLIFTDIVNHEEVARLYTIGFPMVYLHQTPPFGLHIPYVCFENKAGAKTLMDHLIEVHHRKKIAYLQGEPGNEDSQWREEGYREALLTHGVEFDPNLVVNCDFNPEKAAETVHAWIKTGREFDAIFAVDDDTAVGVLMALREAGIRVPQDVSVVGFDDIPTTRYLFPPLTTVRTPIETAGYEAAHKLVRLIRSGEADLLTMLPTEFIIRESCGCKLNSVLWELL